MQPDLRILVANAHLFERLGWSLPNPGTAPWDDHSYLSASERKKPAIQASVQSMTETNAMITFVLVHEDGAWLGYWHGPRGTPLDRAAVVCLDNEGQYSIRAGCVAGALLETVWDEDRAVLSRALRDLGIRPLDTPKVAVDPNDWHDARFDALLS